MCYTVVIIDPQHCGLNRARRHEGKEGKRKRARKKERKTRERCERQAERQIMIRLALAEPIGNRAVGVARGASRYAYSAVTAGAGARVALLATKNSLPAHKAI